MIHRLGDAYRSVVSSLSATSTESKFVQEGKLTPEEFIATGDQLVYKFPTWEWASGDPSRRASYLPEDKQYLITRQVPCKDRVKVLDRVLDQTTREVDGWLTFEGMASRPGSEAGDDLAEGANAESAAAAAAAAAADLDDGELGDDDGLPDFGDLDADLADEGDAAAASTAAGYIVAAAPDETARIRTYDLSVTYDKYYQVPRMWLFGYDEYSNPLKPNEVFEDVLKEYREKTVTVDPHPLTGTPTVSIHPCKHSLVMKKVVDGWLERGITPVVDNAIFVFLKFISGVVPTINYDFTTDMEF
eukprot:CAMPEP_0206454988 /NCGR_PEP_ID=MMETSP0324_2-20121206/21477_1 /ASSEMBLY_ACC=CAM_ASM_000836 /TAXON_ID=2866 /ORGANISM="Crypthecodinium cohnii, Strain Seligo" /LENGTH=301 /DNA_ID=CAMNT_0053925591 /DNA_START=60 /DNA_END=965 /DNA_ORIENTATION=+